MQPNNRVSVQGDGSSVGQRVSPVSIFKQQLNSPTKDQGINASRRQDDHLNAGDRRDALSYGKEATANRSSNESANISRRKFIASSALASAAFMIVPSHVL